MEKDMMIYRIAKMRKELDDILLNLTPESEAYKHAISASVDLYMCQKGIETEKN